MSTTLPENCDRTRQHVSLRLDTEISELEEALVVAHLRQCAQCWAFAADLEALTETLRTAPLAEPSVRFQLPRRRARTGVTTAGTAAAAAISALVAVVGVVSLYSSAPQISASDIQSARHLMVLKERQMQELEGTTARPARHVPRGLAAAKDATLNPTQGAG